MKLQFDANQEYQLVAARTGVDLFKSNGHFEMNIAFQMDAEKIEFMVI